MAKRKEKPQETVRRNLKTKTIYHYVNSEIGIDVKSREVFKNRCKEVHYPFRTKEGAPKYNTVNKITYEDMPSTLPAGFLKAAKTGYGFTRELNPLLYTIMEEFPSVDHIIVSGSRANELIGEKTIVLSASDLENARKQIGSQQDKHREESRTLCNNILSKVFPSKFKKKVAGYSKGQLSGFVNEHDLKPGLLSEADMKSIADLMSMLPSEHQFVKKGGYLTAKKSFDKIVIKELVKEYRKLLKRKQDTKKLEDDWQKFFKDNILFFNFGYVDRFEKERIQGDKSINIPDFILLNTYSYLDVFEIKTHLTQLLAFDKGRNNFYWTSEASKALSQAENYRDSIIKEEDRIITNIRDEYGINVDAVRPVVHIIASSRTAIAGDKTSTYQGKRKKKLWNDFRRLNNSLQNIRFVLYDELLDIFEKTLERLESSQD